MKDYLYHNMYPRFLRVASHIGLISLVVFLINKEIYLAIVSVILIVMVKMIWDHEYWWLT